MIEAHVDVLISTMLEIAEQILKVARAIDRQQILKFLDLLLEARDKEKKVMVVGAGRSGLVGKAFAMRLMHLGFNVYVMGETITPAVSEGDIVIAISGSGTTQIVISVAEAAKKMGARVVAVTSFPTSPLTNVSDHVVIVPGRTKISKEIDYFARQVLGIYEPLAPLGTLFEDAAMVFFDGVVVALMHRLRLNEDYLKSRHANIEVP
ncbi:MAG: 6-phospho-3-hexuloisomerase [Thermofilaceae archaeon]|nr:6-phospho-3-hexuloisomerase [Thermofilaceae archaeon]MCX8180573.1 6-phospho-3-hexuloisomerase [Thermofilaceae archaeon]MDW8003675.1 6-phospho-3-hexuloisomerase [Thermofilaceae archaeon]